jgi:hypothetical protein
MPPIRSDRPVLDERLAALDLHEPPPAEPDEPGRVPSRTQIERRRRG